MTKFIKLTEVYNDGTNLPIVINTSFIASIKKAKGGRDTIINMVGERVSGANNGPVYFFVKQTVDEVEAML
jgi:hypothetical protein